MSYEIFPRVINGPLKIGTSLSFNFLSNEFENYEEILSPETSVFIIDGKTTRKRELSKGKIIISTDQYMDCYFHLNIF